MCGELYEGRWVSSLQPNVRGGGNCYISGGCSGELEEGWL